MIFEIASEDSEVIIRRIDGWMFCWVGLDISSIMASRARDSNFMVEAISNVVDFVRWI